MEATGDLQASTASEDFVKLWVTTSFQTRMLLRADSDARVSQMQGEWHDNRTDNPDDTLRLLNCTKAEM